ncbi:MAG: hypothetical protein ACREBJ_10185 [Nitrosotalea sp.]
MDEEGNLRAESEFWGFTPSEWEEYCQKEKTDIKKEDEISNELSDDGEKFMRLQENSYIALLNLGFKAINIVNDKRQKEGVHAFMWKNDAHTGWNMYIAFDELYSMTWYVNLFKIKNGKYKSDLKEDEMVKFADVVKLMKEYTTYTGMNRENIDKQSDGAIAEEKKFFIDEMGELKECEENYMEAGSAGGNGKIWDESSKTFLFNSALDMANKEKQMPLMERVRDSISGNAA